MHFVHALEPLVQQMPVALTVWRYDAERSALRLVCANRAASTLSGVDLAANVGRTLRELFPKIRDDLHARYVELACSESPEDSELVSLDAEVSSRTTLSVRARTMSDRCVGIVFQDLTEESSLLGQREKRFRALLEHSMDAIVLMDAQAKISFASQSFERILGYAPAEIVGADGFPLVHPDDLAPTREEFAKMLSRPGEPATNQIRMRHRDGSWRLIEVVTVNRLNEPSVQAVVSTFRDITEQRRTEDALRNTERQLQHARKMEAVGRLADGVAHDLNNLLSIVLSYAEMLLLDPNAAHAHRELSEIKRAGQNAAELLRQMLAFSRKQVLALPIIDPDRTRAAGAAVLDGESISAPPERETLTGTETILVVDDDASVRGVARSILMNQGYTVITAASASEAMLYAKHSTKIDLLVTDVTMPDTNGPQLARGLHEVHPTLKVLFMSGYAESDVVHRGLLDHNSRYLQKPLTLSTLSRKVRQVLDEKDPRSA